MHELYLRMSDRDGLAFGHPPQFFVYAALAVSRRAIDRDSDFTHAFLKADAK